MFGLTPILTTRIDLGKEADSSQLYFVTNYGDFTLYSLYVWAVVIILLIIILINLPVRFIQGCIQNCTKKKLLDDEGEINFSDDFYQCVNYEALKENLIKS